MLALRDLQTQFREALFQRGPTEVFESLVAENGMQSSERIAIYRNNVFASLAEALRQTFPVVCRLVGERFFDYAAHEFIAGSPPTRPQLSQYGGGFADFLAHFPPCAELRYLPDVARLEWAMNEAAIAEGIPSGPPRGMGSLASTADPAALRFQLDPSLRYLASAWPIDRIWHANQPGSNGEGVELESGGVLLEVRRIADRVALRALSATDFAFRHALATGVTLGGAIDAALGITPAFQPDQALTALFCDATVAAITSTQAEKDQS